MRTVVDAGQYGTFTLDEPVPHGGGGSGPSPLQAVLGALCGCEAVTFHRTAAEMGFAYESLDFEGAFTIDVRGRKGDRSVRPHFQTVRVRAVVATDESEERLREVRADLEQRLVGPDCFTHRLQPDVDGAGADRLTETSV